MSRYSLKPLPHRADVFEVAVGWDAGLGSFFAIVFGVPACGSDPAIVAWRGSAPRQIPTVSELIAATCPFAAMSSEIAEQLEQDKLESALLPRAALSKLVTDLMG